MSEFYYNIAINNLIKIYLSPEFDLTLTMNSAVSLEGAQLEGYGTYYFDSSNTVTITNFSFDDYYSIIYNGNYYSLNEYFKVTDIEPGGIGWYAAEVDFYQ